jgi:hypothetical protein
MSILPTSIIGGLVSRPAQTRNKSSFSLPSTPSAAAETAPLSQMSTDPLLFLQEVEPPEERDARSKRHGGEVLDLLSGLQRAMLEGQTNERDMKALAKLANSAPMAANPALQAAIEAISLRAHVELARSEMLGQGGNQHSADAP